MNDLMQLVDEISMKYNLPEWFVIAGPIVMALILISLVFFIFKILEPKHRLYKQDLFYNIIWRWKWRGNEIIDLWCYCPTCKAMLYVDDENCKATSNLGEKITFFVCHDCGESEKGRIRGGDRRYCLSVIKREIMNKIRNNTYDIYLHSLDKQS